MESQGSCSSSFDAFERCALDGFFGRTSQERSRSMVERRSDSCSTKWLTGGGYGCAWRVLDAQFFGVAQRRRRLFLVGRAGNGFREACQVLFEPSCVLGSPAESKEKRAELTACSGRDVNTTVSVGIAANQRGEVRLDGGDGATIGAIPATRSGKQLQGVLTMASGQANAEIGEDMCPTQSARQYKDPPIVLSDLNTRGAIDVDVAGTLKVGGEVPSVMTRDVISHAE